MSCESVWHSQHRTFRHDVGRTLIGGGVGGSHNLGVDASDRGCTGDDGNASDGVGDARDCKDGKKGAGCAMTVMKVMTA
jgi:hypothetical protein